MMACWWVLPPIFDKQWTLSSWRAPWGGLSLNKSKCLLSLPPDLNLLVNPLPLEILVTSGGFTLLGAPIGPSSFVSSSLSNAISKLSQALSLLPSLCDSQMESTLLCPCFSLPKLSSFIRTCNLVPLISLYEWVLWLRHLLLPFRFLRCSPVVVVLAQGLTPGLNGWSQVTESSCTLCCLLCFSLLLCLNPRGCPGFHPHLGSVSRCLSSPPFSFCS